MKLPSIKMNRNAAGLAAALAVGTLSFFGAKSYLNEQARAAEERLAADNQKSPILVVRQAMEAGATLTLEAIAQRNVPTKYIPSQALTANDLEGILGQRVVHAMQPGDPILSQSVERSDARPFSAQLEEGRRGITFPVDEVNSFSGLLAPGDVIDLLYSIESARVGAGKSNSVSVRPILQKVPVLATGTTTRKKKLVDNSGAEREVDMQFATITLHVTPEEAQRIILAEQTGVLTAVLRNPEDQSVLSDLTLHSDALTQTTATRAATSKRQAGTIEMIVGNAGGQPSYIRLPVAQRDRTTDASNALVAKNES